MLQIELRLVIRAESGRGSLFHRMINMPFPPVGGMEMEAIFKDSGNLFGLTIESVAWNVHEQRYIAYLKEISLFAGESVDSAFNEECGDLWHRDWFPAGTDNPISGNPTRES